MPKHYEHMHVDLSPAAVDWLATTVGGAAVYVFPGPLRTELDNFANECRARVQHAAAGEPDISRAVTLPGHSTDEDWLS